PPLGAEPAKGCLAGLAGGLGDAVDLHAIAGGEDHHLAEETAAPEVGQDLPHLLFLEGELFSHLHGRRQVVHARYEEGPDHRSSSRNSELATPHGGRGSARSLPSSAAGRRTRQWRSTRRAG